MCSPICVDCRLPCNTHISLAFCDCYCSVSQICAIFIFQYIELCYCFAWLSDANIIQLKRTRHVFEVIVLISFFLLQYNLREW